jgi:uncharacterized UPF0160 family protein
MNLTNKEIVHEKIEETIIQMIDAEDNGIEFSNGKVLIYTIGNIIDSYNSYQGEETTQDEQFNKAVTFCEEVLKREIKKRTIKEEHKEKEIIILSERLPIGPAKDYENIKFIISPRDDGQWNIQTIPDGLTSFGRRHYLPKEWAGLTNETLEETTGIKGAIFCHKNLFIAVAATKEAAINMAEKAVEKLTHTTKN